jgi:hypothetical protein
VDFAALKSRWQDASVLPDTLVWTKGMAKWVPVRDVPGLEDALDA